VAWRLRSKAAAGRVFALRLGVFFCARFCSMFKTPFSNYSVGARIAKRTHAQTHAKTPFQHASRLCSSLRVRQPESLENESLCKLKTQELCTKALAQQRTQERKQEAHTLAKCRENAPMQYAYRGNRSKRSQRKAKTNESTAITAHRNGFSKFRDCHSLPVLSSSLTAKASDSSSL